MQSVYLKSGTVPTCEAAREAREVCWMRGLMSFLALRSLLTTYGPDGGPGSLCL